LQGEVEEHNLRVRILADVTYGTVGQIVEWQDIRLVDKPGEIT
jgi:hypothetical protein